MYGEFQNLLRNKCRNPSVGIPVVNPFDYIEKMKLNRLNGGDKLSPPPRMITAGGVQKVNIEFKPIEFDRFRQDAAFSRENGYSVRALYE